MVGLGVRVLVANTRQVERCGGVGGCLPECRSAKETHQTDTTEPQYATSADQPVAQVADHQSRFTTPESADPNTADPAPTESELRQSSDGRVSVTPVERFALIPSMAAPEPDWDAMALVGTAKWYDEPPF